VTDFDRHSTFTERRLPRIRWPALLIVCPVLLSYSNSLNGAFMLDDWPNVLENPSIRSPWPPVDVLTPPQGTSVAGRPVVNLTFALNYAVSGERTWSYHLLNLLIHTTASLVLFGILCRTFISGPLCQRYGRHSTGLALAASLLWAVHPLQTQSVTYITQRCESLMGLFFLLTVYCAIRGWESPNRIIRWHTVSVLSCFAGVGAKETIAVTPILIFVYDVIFIHRTVKSALSKSWWLYSGYFLCLIFLGFMVMGGGTTGGAIGPHSPLEYARTQSEVIIHYIRLALWTNPLCFDYAWPIAKTKDVLPCLIAMIVLLGLSLWTLFRRRPLGFLYAWFFLILAPTSSFIPLPDLAFEYRMYLPLAAITTGLVIAGYEILKRISIYFPDSNEEQRRVILIVNCFLLITSTFILGALTFLRNRDYRSETAIWADTIVKAPNNNRAYTNLACALTDAGRPQTAIHHFLQALEIEEQDAKTHNGLANAYSLIGKFHKALVHYRRSIELDPDYAEAYYNMGKTLCELGEFERAISSFQKALQFNPNYADAHNNLGLVYAELGQVEKAIAHYRRAMSIDPRSVETLNNLGNLVMQTQGARRAIEYYKRALSLDSDYAKAHNNLGLVYLHLGKPQQAIPCFEKAIRLDPKYANAYNNLGAAYTSMGDSEKAVACFREALQLDPDHIEAKRSLERLENDDSAGQEEPG